MSSLVDHPLDKVQRFRWYATINHFSQEDIDSLEALPHKELVIGQEEAPSTGTPHLHVYISLEKKLRLAQMKQVCSQAHWEPVKDRTKCIEYCCKSGNVLCDQRVQGRSRELDDAIECLRNSGLPGCARDHPYQFVLHSRGLRDLQYAIITGASKPVPKVSWFYGNTGSGKTRTAFDGMDPDNIFFIPRPPQKSHMWFDGYVGQKRAILDDFRPWQCSFSFLLNLLDRYPMQVPVKGGFVNWIPEEIIITCPLPPEELFSGEYQTKEDMAQLNRRIHRRVHFVSFNAPTATFSLSSDAVCAYSPDGQLVSLEANQSPPERFPLPSGIPLLPETPPSGSQCLCCQVSDCSSE